MYETSACGANALIQLKSLFEFDTENIDHWYRILTRSTLYEICFNKIWIYGMWFYLHCNTTF